MDNKNKILAINFKDPWWYVFGQVKLLSFLVLLCEIVTTSFSALFPLILAYIFKLGRLDYFIYFCLAWIVDRLIEYGRGYLNSILQLRLIYSVQYNAHSFFLEIDPIYHAQRASGAILGKINRAARGFEDILDVIASDILPMTIGIVTVICLLFYQTWWLGVGGLVFLGLMALVSTVVIKRVIIPNERAWLRADDVIRSISTENLSQVHLIRACFASNQLDSKLKDKGIIAMQRERRLWLSYIRLHIFNKIIYIGPIIIFGLYLLAALKKGTLESVEALGLLNTYFRGTRDMLKLDKPIMKSIKSLTRINDLFDFIRVFGKQTFPVLEPAGEVPVEQCIETDSIIVKVQHLYFDYHKDAKIFDDNSMTLDVPCDQANKLYGIIGPSGVGKSTFVSILGGQIKPTRGRVLIDNTDIYRVDDRVRKHLIALQGQVATNMRGSLRYNLLFGLPEPQAYNDDHLIDILARVGLWPLFEAKKGLNTFIGEGGLNLSGGQRQRLNFASLYLRAQHYNPRLILIDEPTSSLDELSEMAITQMIFQLAQSAITVVIAHRIKTVEHAVGLLDFTVLGPDKELKFYTHEELIERSDYYRKLVRGQVPLEE